MIYAWQTTQTSQLFLLIQTSVASVIFFETALTAADTVTQPNCWYCTYYWMLIFATSTCFGTKNRIEQMISFWFIFFWKNLETRICLHTRLNIYHIEEGLRVGHLTQKTAVYDDLATMAEVCVGCMSFKSKVYIKKTREVFQNFKNTTNQGKKAFARGQWQCRQ